MAKDLVLEKLKVHDKRFGKDDDCLEPTNEVVDAFKLFKRIESDVNRIKKILKIEY